jgi:hypothetical protein
MQIDSDAAAELGVAFNEADLLGAEYDAGRNLVATTFAVLTLPDDESPEPTDRRRQIIFSNVGRIVARLCEARSEAPPIPFAINDLLAVVQSFGGQPVYGWQFINPEAPGFECWPHRPSLLLEPPGGSLENRIALFQEGGDRDLDLWIYFEDLSIRDPLGATISIAEFTAGGRRWWDALHAGDPRTQGRGIVPIGNNG